MGGDLTADLIRPRLNLHKRDNRIGNRTTVFHCNILRPNLREKLNIRLEETGRLSSKLAAKAFTLNISVQSSVNTFCHSRSTLYVVSSHTLYTYIQIMQ